MREGEREVRAERRWEAGGNVGAGSPSAAGGAVGPTQGRQAGGREGLPVLLLEHSPAVTS